MAARREYPRQPRRPIRRVVASTTATRGSLALADPVVAVNPYQSGAQIYPTGMTSPDNAVRNPNPPIDKISPDTPPLTNYGATGTSFFGGIIQSDEYNPEFGWRDAVIKFEQMSRNEAQVMAIKQQYEMPILAAKWSIEPASDDPQDQEIASFVQSCLMDDMCYTTSEGTQVYQSWNETLRQILMYKWYGFMLLELCFRIEDGWVKWSRWLPLLPRTVWRWYVGDDNELESVEQWAYKQWTYQYNRIPRGKLLHFANRMEGQNYQGVSVLRSAFKNWWYKQQFEKIAAIEIERNAIIPPVIKMGMGPSADEVNAALKLAQNIRANELMGVVIGHDMDFQYPRMTERGAAQILPLIEYHDNMIARNILGQFINLGSHEVGSYALAQQQVTNFLNTLQGDCQYVCDIINHQAIRQLVDYNYDGVAVYPKLTCSRLVSQDITTLSTALQYLGSYVPPSPEVNDAIADALGLPKPPQSMVETTNPTSPSDAARPENQRADDHSDSDSAQTKPGHASGGGGGRSDNADYQDTLDGGGGDGTGFSEPVEPVESQALTEFRLLRESLDAFHEQVTASDAVERGTRFLGGHEPGYTQNRDAKGHWAPGEGDAHEGGHGGSGRGRGGAGGGESSHTSKGEHEATAKSSGGRGSGSRSGAGRAAKVAKTPEQQHHEKVGSAHAKVAEHEARVKEAAAHLNASHGRAFDPALAAHTAAREDLAKAQKAAARLEGRQLHPAEIGHTREEFLSGKAVYTAKGQIHTVSKEEAHAWLNGGNKAGGNSTAKAPKEPSATKTRAPRATKAAKSPSESIHERSARLQKDQGLKAEAKPGEKLQKVGNTDISIMPGTHGEQLLTAMHEFYGDHQIGAAISGLSHTQLQRMAKESGLAAGGSHADLVSRITSHVTEGRYSANFGSTHAAKGEKTSTGKASRKAAKSPEEQHAGKVETARTRLDEAEKAYKAGLGKWDVAGNFQRGEEMAAAHRALAKLEGRHLHPAEVYHTREDFKNGRTNYTPKGTSTSRVVSAEEAKAWLNGGNKAPFKEPGKSSRSSRSTKGENEAQKATAKSSRKTESAPLKPEWTIAGAGGTKSRLIDPTRLLDPHFTYAIYGAKGLQSRLTVYSSHELRQVATALHIAHPGRSRDAIAAAITHHVTRDNIDQVREHYKNHPNESYSGNVTMNPTTQAGVGG